MSKKLAVFLMMLLVAAAAYWLFVPRDFFDDRTQAVTEQATTGNVQPLRQLSTLSNTAPAFEAEPDDTLAAETDRYLPAAPVDDGAVPPPLQLDASDPALMEAADQLNPEVVQWLVPSDQIRKWVLAINLLAEGKFPVKNRPLEVALPAFQVRESAGQLWLERSNYRRATALIRAFTAVRPSRVAKQYAAWRSLLQKAQDELGNGKRFDERLDTAIRNVLAVKPLTGEVPLKAGVMKYTYADPALERASALEKALWRLGPSNTLRIQNYLRDLRPLL